MPRAQRYFEMNNRYHTGQTRGFTLVETLIAIGILGIFIVAVATILQNVLENITRSRIRATALSIAQSKMEVINNLPYSSVGTLGGIPAGSLPPTETTTVNNLVFTTTSSVIYVDDPADGVAPADTINTDYKRARVEVSWGGSFPSISPAAFVSNIAAKTSESAQPGGTIMITVYNSFGQAVPGASVTIDNAAVTPEIHLTSLTDTEGKVILPGAPPCTTCYRISTTKQNYSTSRTYSTSEVANPLTPYVTVIDGNLSQISFSIDTVSTIVVSSYNTTYAPVSNVQFTLRGSKTIGNDASDQPVYKYEYSTNTGGFTVSIPALEWDTYNLDLTNSTYTLAGSNPIVPAPLPANSHLDIPIVVVPKSQASLLVIVKNPLNEPLASASARLYSSALSFDSTKFTHATGAADFGQVFFANLSLGNYYVEVSLPGYTQASSSVNISTNQRETLFIAQP